ncbi:DUF4179 domain-containing protein [Paenibacillus sp. P32E]|uniref:DUF4179 domain-containing protein n=1 Tax=Paenibacillus sp. P32E TaxID=1349434 RepID=UPI0015BC348F|nr:DUF4179 domain-containing protein [Paenibacillus sp. P32E]
MMRSVCRKKCTGMERGQQRLKYRFFSRSMGLGIAAAVIAAAILFVLPYLQSVPQPASTVQSVDWGELEVFKENAIFSIDEYTLDSVIRSGYVQMVNQTVNQTAEADGYAITLNAITADENKIMYLYTATTDEKQEIYSINSAKMKNRATDSYLNTTLLDRSQPFPQQLEAEFRIASVNPGKMAEPKTGTIMEDMHYSPILKVSFALDSKFKKYKTQIVKPNLPFTLNGHEVVLNQVEMSPMLIHARVALKNPEDNDWETRVDIFDNALFLGVLSKIHGKSVQLSPVSGGGTVDGYEYAFASNWLDDPGSLVLKIKERTGSKLEEINLKVYTK